MADGKPFFSIVIPTFNASAFLPECLASVLGQRSGVEIEVKIVDDASSDDTVSIAKSIAALDSRVEVIERPVNGGPGAARNDGVDAARGEWILFVDADDVLSAEMTTVLTEKAQFATKRPLDLIGFNWLPYRGKSPHETRVGVRQDADLFLDDTRVLEDYAALRMDGSVIYTAFRRALLAEHDLRFAEGYHEDVDYLFKALVASRGIAT